MLDLIGAINLVKGVVGLTKDIKELSDKTDNPEIKEAAAELRSQTIDLKETVNEMREHILELEERLSFKEKLSFNGKVFEYEEDGKKRFICNGCESKGKFVHMSESLSDLGGHTVRCPVCDNRATLTAGKTPQRVSRPPGNWMSS